MGRIRTIKPELARHEGLFDLEVSTGLPMRFCWAMLPTICDRAGRFKWRPRAIKSEILPYDTLDMEEALDALVSVGQLIKYRCGNSWYGVIPTFTQHQHPHHKEHQSEIPKPELAAEVIDNTGVIDASSKQDNLGSSRSPGGREGKGRSTRHYVTGFVAVSKHTATTTTHDHVVFSTIGTGARSWTLTNEQAARWQASFPGVDVMAECQRALAWVEADPRRRRTARGMPRFLVAWLNRATDRPRRADEHQAAQHVKGKSVMAKASEMFLAETKGPKP
jgi:hypothetical protein